MNIKVDKNNYYLIEHPDHYKYVRGGKNITIYWNNSNKTTFPFGKDPKINKYVIGDYGTTHSDIRNTDSDSGRRAFKYAGRCWLKQKVISFWEYPPLNKLLGELKQIEKAYAEKHGKKFSFSDKGWKVDLPRKYELPPSIPKPKTMSSSADFGLYFIKTLKNKGKGEIEDLSTTKTTGKVINVDQGQQHVAPPIMKVGKKMSASQKKKLHNYYKNKGKLSPDEERMWRMINKEGLEYNIEDSRFISFGLYGLVLMELDLKTGAIIYEAPHIAIGDKTIDLEFEVDKTSGLKKIIKAMLKQEITDKHGDKFKLTTDKEVSEFMSKVLKNSQIKSLLK